MLWTQKVQLWHHEMPVRCRVVGNCGELGDTLAPMVFSWNGWLAVAIKGNFTGRETKQYSGERGL